jgi:hypothetical protein
MIDGKRAHHGSQDIALAQYQLLFAKHGPLMVPYTTADAPISVEVAHLSV